MISAVPRSAAEAKQLQPLMLAYIGDAVYELRVREQLLDAHMGRMPLIHRAAVRLVNAECQSRLYDLLTPLLSEEEAAILRRGRNAKSGHQPPTASPAVYRRATGVEALFGYWFLIGAQDRLDQAFDLLFSMPEE